ISNPNGNIGWSASRKRFASPFGPSKIWPKVCPARKQRPPGALEMKLTTLRAGDIARTRKKGGLNFLYLKDAPNFPLHKRESSEHRKGWKQWLSRANHAT